MGKGDQRSRRGKIHRGTFGKRRPKPTRLRPGASAATAEAAQTTRDKSKEAKVVKKQPAEAAS